MVQLRVQDGSSFVFLDLYEEEPIKLTLSIEDIQDTSAKSAFSRSFRVPSTGKNNKFFKHAFIVEGIDFDITVRQPATILVDGDEFRSGHVRLQKIYRNRVQDTIEYEIVFMGETRDFASALGDRKLTDLDLSEYDHELSYTNVTTSWQAYPEGAAPTPGVPGTGDGLFNGDILYPLVDFGDVANQPRVKYSKSQNGGGFNFGANAITPSFFRPMIRAKALWDKIFEESGFTYSSNIANDPGFTQLYVSAFGNDPDEPVQLDGSANHLEVKLNSDYYINNIGTVKFDNEVLDPNDNYDPTTGIYTAPITSVGTDYSFELRVDGRSVNNTASPSQVIVRLKQNANILAFKIIDVPANTSYRWLALIQHDEPLTVGDEIYVEVAELTAIDYTLITVGGTYFKVTQAPGDVGVNEFFDSEYKQIDFIKDMITKFRLVMAPDKEVPKKFIIETWTDYVATGEVFDWTGKVDHNMDFQIEPIFFSQTDEIDFTDTIDSDFLNERNNNKFKEVFGTVKFDSGNELLIGKREVKSGFAPTPLMQIDGARDSNFLIPKIYNVETETIGETNQGEAITDVVREPIKPVTRLLFYNGLMTQAGTDDFAVTVGPWYFLSLNPTPQSQFPMVSYWQEFDGTTGAPDSSLNLNWQVERGYAYPYGTLDYTKGTGMFDTFWAEYISNIYNKYARKITCHVVLDTNDIQRLSFDDVIFIEGSYYRPDKIYDVVVGKKSSVKVELIKLLNYQLG